MPILFYQKSGHYRNPTFTFIFKIFGQISFVFFSNRILGPATNLGKFTIPILANLSLLKIAVKAHLKVGLLKLVTKKSAA